MAKIHKTCSVENCNAGAKGRGLCSKHYQRMQRHGSADTVLTNAGSPKEFAFRASQSKSFECIPWPYSKSVKGYGQIRLRNRLYNAHRYVLLITHGEPPLSGMHAAHDPTHCTSRLCVNPRHLRWATASENSADRNISGTMTRGEEVAVSKLTEKNVLSIRADNRLQRDIADEYGVTQQAISRIKRGEDWAWL